jgi:hypothetical protein
LRKVEDERSSLNLEKNLVLLLLKEYENMFQAISTGLPPKREMAHTKKVISLLLGLYIDLVHWSLKKLSNKLRNIFIRGG